MSRESGAVLVVEGEPDLACVSGSADDGIRIETVAEAEEALARVAAAADAIDALVLPTSLDEPLELAQRAHAIDRNLAVVVLCEPERCGHVERALEFAPFVGGDVVAVAVDGSERFRSEIEAAAGRTRRRRERTAAEEPEWHASPAEQYLGRLLDRAPIGVAVVDLDGAVIGWNRHAGEILGAREREVVGMPLATLFPREEGRRLAALVSRARDAAAAAPSPETFRRTDAAGEAQIIEVSAAPTTGRTGRPGVMVALRDVTAPVLAEERLRFLAEATSLLAEPLDLEATLASVARSAIPTLADWCIIDKVREDGTIARVAVAAASPHEQRLLEELRDRYPVTRESPQPSARALREGKAVIFERFTRDTLRGTVRDDDHFALIAELDPHATLALPLVAHGQTLGAIAFAFARSRRRYGEADVALAEEVARRVALAIDRARVHRREQRARLDAEAAHERVAFLGQATELLAGSLEYEVTLERLASLAVPRLADWCIVYVLEEGGDIRRLAVEHVDRALRDRIVTELAGFDLDPDARAGVAEVIRTGRPEFRPEATADLLAADVVDPAAFAPVLARLGITSWICVPLRSRGRTLGAISLVSAESGRRYRDEDLTLALELARRAAVAVDNARLYREAQEALASRERTSALLETLLATAPVGLGFFDEDLRYVLVNDALAEINGVPAGDHIGRTVFDVLPELGAEVARHLRRVLETGEPIVDIEVAGSTPAAPDVARNWLVSYYPVRLDGKTVGVGGVIVEITERKRTEEERARLLTLEREARAAAERAERRVTFLAEASRLLASSLDYELTLEHVAKLAVPTLADWCAVDIASESSSPRRLAIAHADPAKLELVRDLERRYPPDPDAPRGPVKVIETGEPELVPEIPDELLVAATRDAEHLALVRRLGLRSYMCVPMAAHGRTLGAITLAAAESGRSYGPDDLALAQSLAGRAACARSSASRKSRELSIASAARPARPCASARSSGP